MRIFLSLLLAFTIGHLPRAAMASVMEPDYNSEHITALTPVYGLVGSEQKQADLGFIEGMRPHHEGALSMSEDYVHSGKARNTSLQVLAGGIVHNQKFEIYILDSVKRRMDRFHPRRDEKIRGVVAVKGLAQYNRYRRLPMPVLGDLDNVSAEDVRFAKAMIIHHQGAVDMAHAYLNNPAAENDYLRALCFDILRDQPAEIGFMQSVVEAYKGDASSIKIDPSMVHGMGGMTMPGMGHHH